MAARRPSTTGRTSRTCSCGATPTGSRPGESSRRTGWPCSRHSAAACDEAYKRGMAMVDAPPVLPPGPNLPPLVQTILFMTARRHVLSAWRRRYGDVFTSRIAGGRTVVTLTQPAHIREVFAGAPTVFHAGEGNGMLAPVMG